jgi:dTDP-glucose 4,6-dehydratase
MPGVTFETGLSQTVEWYLKNSEWCEWISSTVDPETRIGSGIRNIGTSE